MTSLFFLISFLLNFENNFIFIFLLQIDKEQVRFFRTGRRRVIWPVFLEHHGLSIRMPFEWFAEGKRNCHKKVRDAGRLLAEGRGIHRPVVYMFQRYQVVNGVFKVVNFISY